MKHTDRELNNIIDDVTAEIGNEKLDPKVVEGAAQRVWARIAGEQIAEQAGIAVAEQVPAHIRSCEDFQALIPSYLQGVLSSARTALLEDHTRECVPCRKALKVTRHGNKAAQRLEEQKSKLAASRFRMNTVRWAVAAVLAVGLGLFAWPWIQRFTNSINTLQAVVEAAQGTVYKVTESKTQAVRAGERLIKGERIRTSKDSRAVVKLGDGTLVEMRERSEFSVNDTADGTTINLERGQVIVQAAKQRDRKLFVRTEDSLVSVTGTIFTVNNGTKGARVSVIEGEVHLNHAGSDTVLRAGDQATTHQSVGRVSVQDEVRWSRDADRYAKMLEAVRRQIDQQLAMPGNRYSTRLLDMMPENTAVYMAIPNISETLARADQILQENLQRNDELRQWWESEQRESKSRGGLNQAIGLVREFGSHLGDEIVLGAEAGAKGNGEPQVPFVIAEVRDGNAFRNFIEGHLGKLGDGKRQARFIDDPMTAPAAEGKNEFYIWMRNGLVAVSPKLDSLKSLSGRMQQQRGANPFVETPFHAHIASLYREGAGLLIAADLDRLVMTSMRKDKEAAAAQQLGLTDLRYFVVEVKEKDGRPYNRAVVSFDRNQSGQNQRGITQWLAAPGPMGALEFISPDANIVAAFVVNEPTALVNDLLETLRTADPEAHDRLMRFQQEQGFDLRTDFAKPLGSEYAFAIDGPVLPVPSWKAVFQVDDQAHLQLTFERTVDKLNAALWREGKQGFAWSRAESGGRVYYTLKSLDFGLEVNYAYAYGYFIAAPSRALVENAIKYKESGFTLLQSAKFKATLPEDRQANFSAMVYQNIGSLVKPVARAVGGAATQGAPKEARSAIQSLLGGKAGLAYVYALNDRLIFSVNTEDGPLNLSVSDFLGLPGFSGLGHIVREATR
jgi:ferric-dicitrate binding protein FerR (iron transport regulator)